MITSASPKITLDDIQPFNDGVREAHDNVDGLDGKDRRRLRKLLRRATRNLTEAVGAEMTEIEPHDDDEDA